MSDHDVPKHDPKEMGEAITEDSLWEERYPPELRDELVRIAHINEDHRDEFLRHLKEFVYQILESYLCEHQPTTAQRIAALTGLSDTLLKAAAQARGLDPLTWTSIEALPFANECFKRLLDPNKSEAERQQDVEPDPDFGYRLVEDHIIGIESLSELVTMHARDLRRGVGRHQRKGTASREAIRWLLALWSNFSPEHPTLRIRMEHGNRLVYGPFYEFVEKVLRPISPMNKGLESAITDVLYRERPVREARKNR